MNRIGDPVPIDRFVGATEQVSSVSARIGAVVLAADDGALLRTAGYDLTRGESVRPWAFDLVEGGAMEVWWSRQEAFHFEGSGHGAHLYADARCSRPVASRNAASAICPITVVTEYTTDAGQVPHAAGAVVPQDALHQLDTEGVCSPAGLDLSAAWQEIFVELGAPLPLETLAPMTKVEVGEGRIADCFAGTPDGLPVLSSAVGDLLDRDHGQPCYVQMAADETLRCLPAEVAVHFLDDGCTQPVVAPSTVSTDYPVPTMVSIDHEPATWDYGPDSDDRITVFELGAEKLPATIYEHLGSACSGKPNEDPWFLLGAAVPLDSFEPVMERTD